MLGQNALTTVLFMENPRISDLTFEYCTVTPVDSTPSFLIALQSLPKPQDLSLPLQQHQQAWHCPTVVAASE